MCKSVGISTRAEFWIFVVYSSMNWFISLYLCCLETTNTDIAIGKYLIGRAPFQEENFSFSDDTKMVQQP